MIETNFFDDRYYTLQAAAIRSVNNAPRQCSAVGEDLNSQITHSEREEKGIHYLRQKL